MHDLENFRENNGKTAFLMARVANAKALRLEIMHPRFWLLAQPLPAGPHFPLDVASLKRLKLSLWKIFSRFDERRPFCFLNSVFIFCFFISFLTLVLNVSLDLGVFPSLARCCLGSFTFSGPQ